ncbi:vanadium-dependent haloperoxidase [Emticicia sp. BO119]|uniref:vanadium-dependent haloperoxidase n=1 Tax=Emticicia sp. BO119 TaxID=2757768 RepID=UPI001C6A3D35|nr:vanadium-dependent haloperoxidase [Emticicia sp. BO119]
MVQLFITVVMVIGNVLAYANDRNQSTKEKSEKGTLSADIPVKWSKMTLKILKGTPGGSPTYGSRSLGYMGITMYESVVHGNTSYKSLAGQLNGLASLPQPEKNLKYNWAISLNASQAYLLKQLYEQTSASNKASIDSLENAIYQSEANKEVAQRSATYGQEIAKAIFEWSKTDGGYQGYKRNFDSTYALPSDGGSWQAPPKGQSPVALPLHPFWGKNRTFVSANGELEVPKKIPYSYKKDSDYYSQMYEVYKMRSTLTQEQKEIANWWGDDPSETFSPPGHSYNLATITIVTARADFFKATQTYAKVGMAVADAFINCWKCKYYYHAQRPWYFIFYNIATLWDLYWPEPPFPAFYSGHAAQAAAAATVLANIYGTRFQLTDDSHVGRPMDTERVVEYKARKFNSFWQVAIETADSRMYGGIHTCHDNEVGLKEGTKIGNNVNALSWQI